jgi:hypothetical protein
MSWGQQLVKGLDSEVPLDQHKVVQFLQDNPQILHQLTTPKDGVMK